MDYTHFVNFLQKHFQKQADDIGIDALLSQNSYEKLIKLLVQKSILENVSKEIPTLLKKYLKDIEKDFPTVHPLLL